MGSDVKGAPSSSLNYYYVAVGQVEDKMTTLVELLHALLADQQLCLAIACSSRAALDSLVYGMSQCPTLQLVVLHADLPLEEMVWRVQLLKQRSSPPAPGEASPKAGVAEAAADAPTPAAAPPAAQGPIAVPAAADVGGLAEPADGEAAAPATGLASSPPQAPPRPTNLILASTDACLRALPKSVLPVGLPLLIQFDMPSSKDVYMKRISSIFGGSKERRRGTRGVVIDLVLAGELPAFRARERFTAGLIQEMPVHVPDILMPL